MFELYFGAFDVLLYALAMMTAIMVSGDICDAMESAATPPIPASIAPPSQSAASNEPSSAPTASHLLECQCPTVQHPLAEEAARSEEELHKPVIQLSDIKLYQLHQRSVVLQSALPFSLPDGIKRYMLRGKPVVRLESLREIATVIA